MALPVLPQDVFDEIISQLIGETSTLKSCSLVCRSFRRNAQKMLFNYTNVMLVYDDNDIQDYSPGLSQYIGPAWSQPINLVFIVKHAPHLIEYIQALRISCFGDMNSPEFNDNDTADLANALGVFSCKGEFPINLRSFSLEFDDQRWGYMDRRVQDTLMLLMSAGSLRHIALIEIFNCPAKLLQNLPPLKHLSLTGTTFSSLLTTQKELPKLESCSMMGAHDGLDQISNIMNTSQLKTFEGGDCTSSTMLVFEQILRPASNSLEHLTLREFNITNPDSVSINLNRFSRLTNITIYQHSIYTMSRMLILITKMMKSISHRNVIQNLLFQIEYDTFNEGGLDLVTKDVWQEVDTIWSIPQLVSSESFHGITFSIQLPSNCDAFSDPLQNKLPETKKAGKLHVKMSLR